MRLARPTLFALTAVFAIAACTSAPATWTYAPAPSATALPSPAGSAEASAPSTNVQISASGVKFEQTSVDAPAGVPFKIDFDNKDAGTPHNIVIHRGDPNGEAVFTGATFNGVAITTYEVPALDAGTYAFVCSIHPSLMSGTLTTN
jgi:plastocyanin